MVRLEDYGYKVTNGTNNRHRALGKAVQRLGYERVYNALNQRMQRANDYRRERYRADRNWVKKKARKVGKTVS